MVTGYSNILTYLVRGKVHTLNLANAATHELFGLLAPTLAAICPTVPTIHGPYNHYFHTCI